jgi:hypothetical protein
VPGVGAGPEIGSSQPALVRTAVAHPGRPQWRRPHRPTAVSRR